MSPFSIPIRRIIKNISCSLLLMAHFLPCHAADVESNKVMAGVLKALEGRDAKIESITAYAIPVDADVVSPTPCRRGDSMFSSASPQAVTMAGPS